MTKEKDRAGRRVTETERELWEKVTQSIEPLSPRRKAGRPVRAATKPADPIVTTVERVARPAKPDRSVSRPPQQPSATKTKPQPGFDAKKARKVAAGKIEIDASLDLHGLRQSDARPALRAFLAGAQAKGYRHVRVITGKGRTTKADAPFDLFDDSERGILRRLVPRWLGEADLAPFVVGFGPAGRGQGGDGALVVHVRRIRGAG